MITLENFVNRAYKLLFGALLVGHILAPNPARAGDVHLSWEKPNDSRVTGYRIFYGLSGTEFTSVPQIQIDSEDITSCVMSLSSGDYMVKARSNDADGNESIDSEILFFNVLDIGGSTVVTSNYSAEECANWQKAGDLESLVYNNCIADFGDEMTEGAEITSTLDSGVVEFTIPITHTIGTGKTYIPLLVGNVGPAKTLDILANADGNEAMYFSVNGGNINADSVTYLIIDLDGYDVADDGFDPNSLSYLTFKFGVDSSIGGGLPQKLFVGDIPVKKMGTDICSQMYEVNNGDIDPEKDYDAMSNFLSTLLNMGDNRRDRSSTFASQVNGDGEEEIRMDLFIPQQVYNILNYRRGPALTISIGDNTIEYGRSELVPGVNTLFKKDLVPVEGMNTMLLDFYYGRSIPTTQVPGFGVNGYMGLY